MLKELVERDDAKSISSLGNDESISSSSDDESVLNTVDQQLLSLAQKWQVWSPLLPFAIEELPLLLEELSLLSEDIQMPQDIVSIVTDIMSSPIYLLDSCLSVWNHCGSSEDCSPCNDCGFGLQRQPLLLFSVISHHNLAVALNHEIFQVAELLASHAMESHQSVPPQHSIDTVFRQFISRGHFEVVVNSMTQAGLGLNSTQLHSWLKHGSFLMFWSEKTRNLISAAIRISGSRTHQWLCEFRSTDLSNYPASSFFLNHWASNTQLDFVSKRSRLEQVEWLLQAILEGGAEINSRCGPSGSALSVVFSKRNTRTIQLVALVRKGAMFCAKEQIKEAFISVYATHKQNVNDNYWWLDPLRDDRQVLEVVEQMLMSHGPLLIDVPDGIDDFRDRSATTEERLDEIAKFEAARTRIEAHLECAEKSRQPQMICKRKQTSTYLDVVMNYEDRT